MAGWSGRRRARSPTSAGARALALLVLLALSIGLYVYRQRTPPTLATIVGTPHVIDGDTIEIRSTRIRLEGIDAPELAQTCNDAHGQPWPCGSAAARELRRHVSGRELTCEPTRFDQFKRVLAICLHPDGSDVNAWMVRQGWALAFRTSTRYRREQDEAAAAKRGLWAGTFIPPWEWRETHRPAADRNLD